MYNEMLRKIKVSKRVNNTNNQSLVKGFVEV